jgi:hypothetical protein
MSNFIKKLPPVFQTITQRKFFDATFDQVFSKKDSSLLSGYIGRRNPGSYNPVSDFYIPEPSKNRTWWQLEATAYSRNTDTTRSNVFFYDDLLEKIDYLGGNTLNQDRLFESEYYSFGPPIDYDMFINYQNYYWVYGGLPAINITGVMASDIIGKQSFNTNEIAGATPANLQLSTGMTINLVDETETAYSIPLVVEKYSNCQGIQLVAQNTGAGVVTGFEYLPWDGTVINPQGNIVDNSRWDMHPWDVQEQLLPGDYITIQRSDDFTNLWSSSNKWFHIDVINQTRLITGTPFPTSSSRALRPIIQFEANLELFPGQVKTSINQPPKFMLYDHDGVALNNPTKYPNSTFNGSEIFSYKIDTSPSAVSDNVLLFPITYIGKKQLSDIVFQNNLMTDRYTYAPLGIYNPTKPAIDGYYYYKFTNDGTLYNSWNLYNNCTCDIGSPTIDNDCINVSKQRVIDKFVVGYGTEYQFRLSVTPYGYPTDPDIIVSVNGTYIKNNIEQVNGYYLQLINDRIYVNLTDYLSNLLLEAPAIAPVVEIQTYTHDILDPAEPGYYQIPQQLEANPTQNEVFDLTLSQLTPQFVSIMQNQIGFTGIAFGGNNNNYRDSQKNRSVGTYILQNVAPTLKSMLVSSSEVLDFITAERFSQDEYTKFKNKYLSIAKQLIDTEFNPVEYYTNTVTISLWVEEILKRINISKEFSNAFAYSYMIANGTPLFTQTNTITYTFEIFTLTDFIDIEDAKNALYVYDITGVERLLVIGEDYDVVRSDGPIQVKVNTTSVPVGSTILFLLYKNSLPAYIPSTPTKIGAYQSYVPRIELDGSYAIPTEVVIGHDGSKTIAFGDYRDELLLELEKRIYNLLLSKYRNEYSVPLRLESVKPGYFRKTRYSRNEYLTITEPYLNKWAAKNKANYRINDWYALKDSCPPNSLWKLYNYSTAIVGATPPLGAESYYLPGNWKGIFQYYYDTLYPNTRPWEMLGFSQKPTWWESEYGAPVTNPSYGKVWPNNPTYATMWADIELGIIRQGPSAIFDSFTLQPLPQQMWARPGLTNINPVDFDGNLRTVPDIFNITIASPYSPFSGFDNDWVYGDGAPVEQAWMSTSGYTYSVQEFLFIMRPGPYGELMWETAGTEISPGTLALSGISGPVLIDNNWQYVQNDRYESDDSFFKWFRPKNSTQIVHAEDIDGDIKIRFGYQRWISDRILFLGQNITDVFGQKIRTLDVNLANKVAGFTNKSTTNSYIESASIQSTSNTLLIPTNNFEVLLHKSQPLKRYAYSGVIIRALADGRFSVYGYDLINSSFTVINRSLQNSSQITIGGTPKSFKTFVANTEYLAGEIIKYNSAFYESIITQTVATFSSGKWKKLPGVPINGGISVTYKPISLQTTSIIPYGTVFNNPQEVFDMLIGWGAYLEREGWKFDEVNKDTNQISDWLYSAKQFLFWLNSNWAPDSSIQLSPAANTATLVVSRGYPENVETMSNGVYNILNKYGTAIKPINTIVDRSGQTITISPSSSTSDGIFFLQIHAAETEDILIFDNSTNFNDIIYDPLLRQRQQRLRFYGFRSNAWYGKMEAPGYLVYNNELIPNYNTIVDNMKYYYDENNVVDNPSVEDLGRHLIGYESKSYLDNLLVSNDVQYLFYQGFIRQKGTTQTFEKLFRSNYVKNEQIIDVYEEWALKLGEFGNTIEQVSTEIVLQPEQNAGDIIIARLNYVPSGIGSVREIKVLNAENIYTSVPKPVISAPDAEPSMPWVEFSPTQTYYIGDIVKHNDSAGNAVYYYSDIEQGPSSFIETQWTPILVTRQAKAYIVLTNAGTISRVDITDHGYGYTKAPTITIDAGSQPTNLDKLYAIYQGDVVRDESIDNIVEIDIDDRTKWVVRPESPEYALTLPTTNNIIYSLPNAGYVNFNDVDWYSFDIVQTAVNWGTTKLNPVKNDIIWVAKTFNDDWNVYKLIDFNFLYSTNSWRIVEQSGQLLLLTSDTSGSPATNDFIVTQFWDSETYNRTEFGNMLVIQEQIADKIVDDNNYTVAFIPYISEDYENPGKYVDPDTLEEYNAYSLVTLDNIPITTADIPNYENLNTLLLYKSMRFMVTPNPVLLPTYVGFNDFIWVDDNNGKWAVLRAMVNPEPWDTEAWDITPEVVWGTNAGWDAAGPFYFEIHREQKDLINTSLFESATIFASENKTQVIVLPVFDPFKGIIPGPAKQNLSYITEQDPARYNVTGDLRLFDDNISFGEAQVGKLWWDLSNVRYVYYEQPQAVDETPTDNLVYRRDNWGRLFPGSTVAVYEWTKSLVPPANYTGSGIPRSTTSYVVIPQTNRFTNETILYYYFWVLNATVKPNLENRTMASLDVSNLLQNPKSQGYSYFSPIQQTSFNNSYIFYNVQDILAYRGNNVQLQYRLSERNDQKHAQWQLFREGDSLSTVSDQYWDKMVDSICAYTKILPLSDEYENSIYMINGGWGEDPWDTTGWDIISGGIILPVPDPLLSVEESYGINYRPRQSMFKNLSIARKVFMQSANSLLKYIPIRDDNPLWESESGITMPNPYFKYTNWYKPGFENAAPNIVYSTLLQAINAVSTANNYIMSGDMASAVNIMKPKDIIQVTNAISDSSGYRFIIYTVTQDSATKLYSLEEVGSEKSAIQILDTVYTTTNKYDLSVQLRLLLNAFRNIIMINEYIVDQNLLFSSMINYALSEQKTPDWVFKTSYIYIKENNIPLTQDQLYTPNQISNIISYIKDAKPYHTKVRGYSSQYNVPTDTASMGMTYSLVIQKVGSGSPTIIIGD